MNSSLAWLFVFLPALIYLVSTRLPSLGFWNELGEPASVDVWIPIGTNESLVACSKLSEIFYLVSTEVCSDRTVKLNKSASSVKLRYPLQLVHSTGLNDIVDMIWRHDSELGRGYLLLSESSRNGRVWRWEVGGGPIAIGKTLHLDASGCRSKRCSQHGSGHVSTHPKGSGAMAIDFYRAGNPSDHSISEGFLVVAEWGEARIVRLETNGARTPLILHVPCMDHCSLAFQEELHAPCTQSIPKSSRMLFTPTGDLIFVLNYKSESGQCKINGASSADHDRSSVEDLSSKVSVASLMILPTAVHIDPLPSLQMSQEAHNWEKIQNHNHSVGALISDPSITWIGGISLASPKKLYASAMILQGMDGSLRAVIFELSIGENEDDDDDADDLNVGKTKGRGTMKVLFDITEHAPTLQNAGAIVVGKSGRIYVATPDGVLIVDATVGGIIGKIPVPKESPTALALGGDGYFYISCSSLLYRIRINDGAVALPTDLVKRRKMDR